MAKHIVLAHSKAQPASDPVCTIEEAIEDFLTRDWSPNTHRCFAADLKRFAQAFGQRSVEQLSPIELQDYLDGLTNRQGEPVAAETYNRHHGTLNNLFGWLERQEELTHSPMIKVDRKRIGERLPRPMTPTQIEKFFRRIDSLRDRVLFSLLYGSGVRISEALSLNIEDLDLAEGSFRVIGKGNRERVGYLAKETIDLLRRYLRKRGRPRRGELFASRQGRLSYAMVNLLFRKYAEGLEENSRALTIHQLRHTFGSERAGVMNALMLRDLMGHKSLKTTLQYAQVNPEEARDAFQAFDRQKGK